MMSGDDGGGAEQPAAGREAAVPPANRRSPNRRRPQPQSVPAPPPPPSAFSLPPALLPAQTPAATVTVPPATAIAPPAPLPRTLVASSPTATVEEAKPPAATAVGIEINPEMHDMSEQSAGNEGGESGGGVFGWFQKAVAQSAFLTKVADKAKSGMDSMMTTLDPQMADFLAADGSIELCIASDVEADISAIKSGFHRLFNTVVGRGLGTPGAADFPAQVVGYTAALEACIEKASRLRRSGLVLGAMPIVAVQALLVDLIGNNNGWHWMACIVLEQNDRHIHAFTQPIHVPSQAIQLLRERTPSTYAFAGFAMPLEAALSELYTNNAEFSNNWQAHLSGITRSDLLASAAIALANQMKNAENSQLKGEQ